MTYTTPIDFDYTCRNDDAIGYCEEIFVTEDSIWAVDEETGEDVRMSAFTIESTDDIDNPYSVFARRQNVISKNSECIPIIPYVYPEIARFKSVDDAKEFIFEYMNDAVSRAILDQQHDEQQRINLLYGVTVPNYPVAQ